MLVSSLQLFMLILHIRFSRQLERHRFPLTILLDVFLTSVPNFLLSNFYVFYFFLIFPFSLFFLGYLAKKLDNYGHWILNNPRDKTDDDCCAIPIKTQQHRQLHCFSSALTTTLTMPRPSLSSPTLAQPIAFLTLPRNPTQLSSSLLERPSILPFLFNFFFVNISFCFFLTFFLFFSLLFYADISSLFNN